MTCHSNDIARDIPLPVAIRTGSRSCAHLGRGQGEPGNVSFGLPRQPDGGGVGGGG